MHGSVYANYAVDEADLLLAFGVRFDDRVTGKVSEFAKHGKIVHIDIDPSEINKNKEAHIPIVSDVKYALAELNKIVEPPEAGLNDWHRADRAWKKADPFQYDEDSPGILPQHAIARLWQLTQRPRHDHQRGRGPASDVGRPVLQVSRAADLAVQLRPGHDGFRPAGRHGGQDRPSRHAGGRHRRRRQLPDEHPGAGHLLLREAAGQGAAA